MNAKTIEFANQLKIWCDKNYLFKEKGDLYRFMDTMEISKSVLTDAFRILYGNTPHGYCLHRKMEEAMKKIASSSWGMEDIAAQHGFCHASHLSSVMQRKCGVTAWQYRERHRKLS